MYKYTFQVWSIVKLFTISVKADDILTAEIAAGKIIKQHQTGVYELTLSLSSIEEI